MSLSGYSVITHAPSLSPAPASSLGPSDAPSELPSTTTMHPTKVRLYCSVACICRKSYNTLDTLSVHKAPLQATKTSKQTAKPSIQATKESKRLISTMVRVVSIVYVILVCYNLKHDSSLMSVGSSASFAAASPGSV